ncbi:MAG TPA: hypothetical protein VIV10_06400 [Gemmatimonadales bacterium]
MLAPLCLLLAQVNIAGTVFVDRNVNGRRDPGEAGQIAVQQAIDFVAAYRGWSKMEAYRLVSVACDVRITELVDGNVGGHVMIPKAIVGAAAS